MTTASWFTTIITTIAPFIVTTSTRSEHVGGRISAARRTKRDSSASRARHGLLHPHASGRSTTNVAPWPGTSGCPRSPRPPRPRRRPLAVAPRRWFGSPANYRYRLPPSRRPPVALGRHRVRCCADPVSSVRAIQPRCAFACQGARGVRLR
jgi:hypothetical protein